LPPSAERAARDEDAESDAFGRAAEFNPLEALKELWIVESD
jgi:hypothetical protein